MKKIAFLLALLPTPLFSQTPSLPNSNGSSLTILTLIIILIILFLLFLAFREVMCWYWKINKTLENQETIIKLLEKIAGENKDNNATNDSLNKE